MSSNIMILFNISVTLCFIYLLGQHECVQIINNFFSIDELDYYTKPQGTTVIIVITGTIIGTN